MSLLDYLDLFLWTIAFFLGLSQVIYGIKLYRSTSGYIPGLIIKIRIKLITPFWGAEKADKYFETVIASRDQRDWGTKYIFVGNVVCILSLSQIFTIYMT